MHPEKDETSQAEKFKELARKVETSDSEGDLDKALRAMRVTPPRYPPSEEDKQSD